MKLSGAAALLLLGMCCANAQQVSSSSAYVAPTQGLGTDLSANRPTLPNVGANFGITGPYASWVLVATVPAGTRRQVDIENNSGGPIAVLRDDGTAAGGAAPVNASVFGIDPGPVIGGQGGRWVTTTFSGRLQIYAPASTAQVAVMVD